MSSDFTFGGSPDDIDDKVGLVRLMIGDTDPDDPRLTDTAIALVIDNTTATTYAAAVCADAIGAQYASQADLKIGETEIDMREMAKSYFDLADRLRKGGAGDLPGGDGTGVPNAQFYIGGISEATNAQFYSDPDKVKPSFSIGQDDID